LNQSAPTLFLSSSSRMFLYFIFEIDLYFKNQKETFEIEPFFERISICLSRFLWR